MGLHHQLIKEANVKEEKDEHLVLVFDEGSLLLSLNFLPIVYQVILSFQRSNQEYRCLKLHPIVKLT